jgi:DNA-binding IclR family transcriptional regulator
LGPSGTHMSTVILRRRRGCRSPLLWTGLARAILASVSGS